MRDLSEDVERLSCLLERSSLTLVTAESCTGGMIAVAMTARAGSSAVFDRGFVTYSNASKTQMLGVPDSVLAAHGAVSEQVATAMARGALERSDAGISVSVTGIAGPSGGSPDKPVGLVYIGLARRDGLKRTTMNRFTGARDSIRFQAARAALCLLIEQMETTPS